MNANAVNQSTYVCPACARVLVTYVHLRYAPVCTHCSKKMIIGPADAVSGQLTLFRRTKRKRT
jgi:ribosomal protein L37AE/L43A